MKSFLMFALVFALVGTPAWSQESSVREDRVLYEITDPPLCINDKNEQVEFREREGGRLQVAAGMANRDRQGKPFILRMNYAFAPPQFQNFIDYHECAHHQTGDVDRPHPPRNSPQHLMNESISDCIAVLRLRDEEGYDEAGLTAVTTAMRADMETIGFPEISISSRISNVEKCYKRKGSPANYIEAIKIRRGQAQ